MEPQTVQDLIALGFEGYRGWPDLEAVNDFKETGGVGKEGGGGDSQVQTPEQIINDIMESQDEIIEREIGFLDKYTADNPFVFDEELARTSAKEQYEPHYSELLEDYLDEVQVQRETVQDEKKLLDTMYKLDTGTRTRSYERAVARAEEGFAGQGMFFSGIKKRTMGEGEVEQGAVEEKASEKYEYGVRGTEKRLEVLETAEEKKERDLGRQETEAVEAGVLGREAEAIKGYNIPLTQSYYRQFPASGGSALSGYTVPDYLAY